MQQGCSLNTPWPLHCAHERHTFNYLDIEGFARQGGGGVP